MDIQIRIKAVKTARVVFPPWAKAAGLPNSRLFYVILTNLAVQ